MLKFLSLSVYGVDPCIFEPTSVANGVIPVAFAGTSTLKNCTLDILCPHKSQFIHRSCHWYSALNKANCTSLRGCNIYVCSMERSSTPPHYAPHVLHIAKVEEVGLTHVK